MSAVPPRPIVAPKLFDFMVARLDDDGQLEMGIRDIAHGIDVGVSTVEHLFARWKALGVLRAVRRGGPYGASIWSIDRAFRTEAVACAAVHPSHIGRHQTRGAARGNTGSVEPPLRAVAPIQTRCPKCNLPPHHAECRHGWDGRMTGMMRRDAAAAAAYELRRMT